MILYKKISKNNQPTIMPQKGYSKWQQAINALKLLYRQGRLGWFKRSSHLFKGCCIGANVISGLFAGLDVTTTIGRNRLRSILLKSGLAPFKSESNTDIILCDIYQWVVFECDCGKNRCKKRYAAWCKRRKKIV